MELTLQNFLDLKLDRWIDEINSITSIAAEEYQLETLIETMANTLRELKFTVVQESSVCYNNRLWGRLISRYKICACDGIGRHAGFRFPCFQRVGSSPFRRTSSEKALRRRKGLRAFSYAGRAFSSLSSHKRSAGLRDEVEIEFESEHSGHVAASVISLAATFLCHRPLILLWLLFNAQPFCRVVRLVCISVWKGALGSISKP